MSARESHEGLPPSSSLPVARLVSTFRRTTNSYKFLWLIALVEEVRDRHLRMKGFRVPVSDLVARMVALAWYPIRQFRLSFGKQDQIGRIVDGLHSDAPPGHPPSADQIANRLREAAGAKAAAELARYVPYRFLSSWFTKALRGRKDAEKNSLIRDGSREYFSRGDRPPVYRFVGSGDKVIELHPEWVDYMLRHGEIVTGFARWGLLRHLEARNPGVPNIGAKLEPPEARRLATPRRLFRVALDQLPAVRCIYTGRPIDQADFSLDHFVPWSFVAHDLLWNLAPVPKEVNSMKGDALPVLDRHLPAFARLQHRVLSVWERRSSATTQYADAFREETRVILGWSEDELERRLRSLMAPLVETARHQGFQTWTSES